MCLIRASRFKTEKDREREGETERKNEGWPTGMPALKTAQRGVRSDKYELGLKEAGVFVAGLINQNVNVSGRGGLL